MPRWWMALTGKFCAKPSSVKTSAADSDWSLSALLMATRTGLPARRKRWATSRSRGTTPFLQIDDKDNDGGRFDGQFDLLEGGLDDDIAGFFAAQQAQAPGVHQGEGASVPFGFDADAVARHARLIVDDGDALAGDAIEQGRLAHIGPSDNGDETGRNHEGQYSGPRGVARTNVGGLSIYLKNGHLVA